MDSPLAELPMSPSCIAVASLPVCACAAAGGLLTWLGLHRRSMRGDYAASIFITAFVICYAISRGFLTCSGPIVFSSTVAGIYVTSALLCTAFYRLSSLHPLAGYPGPPLWRISSLRLAYVSWKGKRHLVLDELHSIYGPFLRIGPNTLSINTLSASSIYSGPIRMEKSEAYNTPGHVKATALFFKQKDEKLHDDRKKSGLLHSPEQRDVMDFLPPLDRRTIDLLGCIERRQTQSMSGIVDLSECICHWSYDFMGEMVFGEEELMRDGDPAQLILGGKKATVVVDSIGQSPWLMDIIWYLPAGRSLTALQRTAAMLMRARIKGAHSTEMRDVSSYLLAGDSRTGRQISQPDLELDALIAIQAGSDNTASTLSLLFYFLLAQTEYYERLQKELDDAFPERSGHMDSSKLTNLSFLNAAINEALRLSTPFFLPRIVPLGGATIGERYIPEGTIVSVAAYSQQVSPDNFFPSPLDFRPERWLPGGLGPGSKAERTALFSFSSGPHMCVAKAFAHQEMRFVTARLVLAFDMKLAEGFDIAAFRDNIRNTRTTYFKPLLVSATRRPGFDFDGSL